MANIAIFRINYKSDFILTLNSDAGWLTPFCIKFWTGAPSQAYFAGYDGTTYTHCAPVDGEPTKLLVQFDDHHLPLGDLKYQIAYHFTVADFPTSVEDEVLNQASVIIEVNDAPAQVMLDFNGETAPEIQFSLPAYANEAQRIENEQQRIANEQQRIQNEETRIAQEETRQRNEATRIAQEEARVSEFARLKHESQQATTDANDAATLANQKAQLAADKAALADDAATLANQKAQLAADKAALANDAAQLANEKAALAQQKAEYAQQQGGYAKDQGDYAKNQGDYAKEQGDTALADHQRAEADHGTAVDDHTQAGNDHTQAGNDHTRAESDHGIAADDHTQAGNDHTRAESDHGIAADDHTQAGNDHTRAESDHTRAESDHAAVEVYVDSLGVFDLSKHNAVGGVLATYADLSAALTALNALDSQYKYGGMSFKFVQSSDNKYVQYRCMAQNFTTDVTQWQGVDDEPTAGSENLVKSGGVKIEEYWNNNDLLLFDSSTNEIDITNKLIKRQGYVSTAGSIVSTTSNYFYTEPFFLKKGYTITWYAIGSTTGIASITNNKTVNIGDTVTVISTSNYFRKYTAEEDIYIVFSGSTLENVVLHSFNGSEYNIRKKNAYSNTVGGTIIHFDAVPLYKQFSLCDYIPKGRSYTVKYNDAYALWALYADGTEWKIREDVSSDVTATAAKDIVGFYISTAVALPVSNFNVTSVAPVPEDYSSEIALLDDKVETFSDSYFGEKTECFNAIPIGGYNNLSSVIPAGTKYHIHFPQNKALYEYYEGGGSYSTIRIEGSSSDVDVVAGGNVNRIYVQSGNPKPSVKMEVTYKTTNGALDEIEGLKDKTEELEEKVNSTYISSNLFIGSLYNDGVKRKMVSLCAVPYHGCSLAFALPEGISAGVISGVSNDTITDAGVVLSNGDTFTFNVAHNYYRLYFTGESLETINTYIADGDISVTFDAENNIVSEQQGCDSYIKNICYYFTSNYANNKMYSMPILCHISDTHGDAMRMKRCIKYCEYLGGVDVVLHSGDAVAWSKQSMMTYIDDIAKDSSLAILPCIGNHEAMGNPTAQDLYDDISYLMTKNNVVTDSNTDVPTYYYKDIAEKKLRIICLNQFFADGRHYTQYELNFFVNALAATPSDYGVLVMAHSPEVRPIKDDNYSVFYRDVTVGEGYVQLADHAKPIQDIVDAFISKTTFTKTYTQNYGNETETLTVNADFTNISSGVEFIAHITGHEHEDCIGYNTETTNKQLMLNITCGNSIMGGSVELANDSDLGRDGKGQSQDAFNIYAIDRVNGTVRIARVGANINNQMKERKYMIIPYKD